MGDFKNVLIPPGISLLCIWYTPHGQWVRLYLHSTCAVYSVLGCTIILQGGAGSFPIKNRKGSTIPTKYQIKMPCQAWGEKNTHLSWPKIPAPQNPTWCLYWCMHPWWWGNPSGVTRVSMGGRSAHPWKLFWGEIKKKRIRELFSK